MTTEQEMIQALEMLISEVCQDNYHSSTSVAAQVIKGFGLTQSKFLKYFGFDLVDIKSFSLFAQVIGKFKSFYPTLSNWFGSKPVIYVESMSDITRLIGMYKCISKFLGNTKHSKYFPAYKPIFRFSLSDDFIIDEDTKQSIFVDYKHKFGTLTIDFNKTNDELPIEIIKAFDKAYSQYFEKITITYSVLE